MSNRQYICATVISTKQLSTNMRRIVLQSEALEHFPQVAPGAYIKLLFDANGQALTSLPSAARDVMMRTYTVRAPGPDQTTAQYRLCNAHRRRSPWACL